MASNFNKAEILGSFRFLFFLIFLGCFSWSSLSAQKIDKYYTSSAQQDAVLYFVYAQKDFSSNDQPYQFEYDLTYLTSKDFLTFNFSVIGKKSLTIERLELKWEEGELSTPTQKIFVGTQGKKWNNRYTAQMEWDQVKEFYQSEKPPVIFVYAKEATIEMKIKKGKWKKEQQRNSKIFELIELNRN